MKKVLVGMDFSQGALNALDYAIDLSLKHTSEIVMLWVEPLNADLGVIKGKRNEIRHDAKLDLESLCQQKSEINPELKLSFKQKKGKIYKEFSRFAASGEFDLAIIGTHGIGGFEEFWVGSNAYKIISYCPCPVISIRTDFKIHEGIKKILLPIDDSLDTTTKVPMAVELAKNINAQIQILGMYGSDLPSLRRKTDHYIAESKSYLEAHHIDYNFSQCNSNNPSLSIVKYAERENVDLMVIMTDQNKASSDIIMGVNSQQIINNSSIPVLSVKPFKMELS